MSRFDSPRLAWTFDPNTTEYRRSIYQQASHGNSARRERIINLLEKGVLTFEGEMLTDIRNAEEISL